MKAHFTLMAEYNAWANARLYRGACLLTEEQYRRDVGAYFKSLHGTLNHLLTADRIWLRRLTGEGEQPKALDTIWHDDLPSLAAARHAEDQRLLGFMRGLAEVRMEEFCEYQNLKGTPQRQKYSEILAHLFNHQTHHRGQAHTILTALGIAEPEPMDLFIMLAERRR